MSCAMFAGGIRTAATRPALPKRELKALRKAAKAEAKTAANVAAPAEPTSADAAAAVEVAPPVRSTTAADWETPWWEDRQPTFAD